MKSHIDIHKPVTCTVILTGWKTRRLSLTFPRFSAACDYIYNKINQYGNVKWLETNQKTNKGR